MSAQRLAGDAVLVQGPDVIRLALLAQYAIRMAKRGGYPANPVDTALVEVLNEAAGEAMVSHRRQTDAALKGPRPHFSREINTAEAARILGVDPRTVQRIYASLGGHRTPSRAYVFEYARVVAYQIERDRRMNTGTQT